ncbi:histidine ammonia-lyase [Marininema halotolerans]|uniref:Histidine ammonia-lyase n=1 Tax=Marininema halotolerans TaxID=1155944 RepID=A0A1I6R4P6_9BACL|nr:histidine ammonia-lyase [Marininema halotolerans]SFS59663.1 histidine ammonia-lyase [Marininema halotolerans]
MTHIDPIVLDGHSLTLEAFRDVVLHARPVILHPDAIEEMNRSREMVESLLESGETVYGITTGFGKFSDTLIDASQVQTLQRNLIVSHACGVGDPLSEKVVRGMMLLRANALAKGHSGIRPIVVERLLTLLNQQIHPVVPKQGSLGASGDLAPLSHMALPLIGEGMVYFQGEKQSASTLLKKQNLSPLVLEAKEGLALINGTQLMASLLSLALLKAEVLLDTADIISALTVEALNGIPHAYHPLLHEARGQVGQITCATQLRRYLQGSERITQPGEKRVQDAYSLRCIPQVHGASRDSFTHVKQIVERELNAATDNPLLFAEEGEVISGGNFHGQPLALVADFLSIAMAELANISERRTERLVNPQLSGLPAFLTHQGGLHSGYMILQYTAASLVSENKTLCHPASVDSIPSSANQEDHVSMGAFGSRKLHQVLRNVTHVLAIESICASQALEFGTGLLGNGTQAAYDHIRTQIPALTDDRESGEDIAHAVAFIQSGKLRQVVFSQLKG